MQQWSFTIGLLPMKNPERRNLIPCGSPHSFYGHVFYLFCVAHCLTMLKRLVNIRYLKAKHKDKGCGRNFTIIMSLPHFFIWKHLLDLHDFHHLHHSDDQFLITKNGNTFFDKYPPMLWFRQLCFQKILSYLSIFLFWEILSYLSTIFEVSHRFSARN